MLMRSLVLGSLLALSLVTPAFAQSASWAMDPGHSEIGFTARHLAFAKVRGKFKTFSAQIEADEKTGKITKLSAEADTKSVDTGIEKRDEHLRSDDFFNAAKFPKLKLELKSIKWKGNKFSAVVALTIRDVTKDVKFEGELLGIQTVNFGQGAHQRAAYEATATIKRQDFGLKFAAVTEGISIVGDEVEIHFQVETSLPPKAG
jgi:polyisoprenoid-binding protein YceI